MTSKDKNVVPDNTASFAEVAAIINRTRENMFRSVNRELILMYWDIGQYVSEKCKTEGWGKSVVSDFAKFIQSNYDGIKGFSPQNIWRMKQFYETYAGNEKLSALLREISWTFIFCSAQKIIIRAANWSVRLTAFILEFGKDFTFVGEEYRVQVGNRDFKIDLLLYNRDLSCLVAIELKVTDFKPEHLDRDVKKPNENPSIGLILCVGKDDEVAEYQTHLPQKALLENKLLSCVNCANLPRRRGWKMVKETEGAFLFSSAINVKTNFDIKTSVLSKAKMDLDKEFESCFIIPAKDKEEIRKGLDFFNVNEATLFPELEHQMHYIQAQSHAPVKTVEEYSQYIRIPVSLSRSLEKLTLSDIEIIIKKSSGRLWFDSWTTRTSIATPSPPPTSGRLPRTAKNVRTLSCS